MPDVEAGAVAQLVVRLREHAHEAAQHGRLVVEALEQAAAQQIPQRRHADDGGDVPAA